MSSKAMTRADAVRARRVTTHHRGRRRPGICLARGTAGRARESRGGGRRDLSMWVFFSRRLRMWLLLAIALPLTRALVHRLALVAERRDPSTRTAKALHQADCAG